jgi:kynurenine formamidase
MAPALTRVDLSPADYVHVPQAPRIERRPILTRGPENEWHMWGVYGVDDAGDRVGMSNHTWSHVDAPFHLLPEGPTFDRLDPGRYLASRARLVDLTASTVLDRRETVNGVDYHSRIDVADLPDLDGFDAVLFVTGFAALYASGYPMTSGADAHYPNVTREAAERLAGWSRLRIVGVDGPSVDKPETEAIAHRLLLGRKPEPVLLLETLTFERLRARISPLPAEVLLTIEPLRAFGRDPDGALASVYAWFPERGAERSFKQFSEAVRSATLIV